MLTSLLIKNFVLIEDASLDLAPGLTVLTGETGAGKTLLTQALGLLLGERAADDLLGPGGDEAVIQAVFDLPEEHMATAPERVRELLGENESELIVTRRLGAGGRGRCFLNGMVVPRDTLRDTLSGLLAFTAQQEHRRLLDPAYQRQVLDAFAGDAIMGPAHHYREALIGWRDASRRLADAERSSDERRREAEMLSFQVGELEAAGLTEEEEQALLREQAVLARAEEIAQACAQATALLNADQDTPDAAGLAAAARSVLGPLQGLDSDLDGHLERLTEYLYGLLDLAREIKRFGEGVTVDQGRRTEVDTRLRLYTDLARKYGGATATALERMRSGRRRLDQLTDIEEGFEALRASAVEWAARLEEQARALSTARRATAPLLEAAVTQQLTDLGMAQAAFSISINTSGDLESLGDAGADSVEFLLASNPGVPARPLARVASGGELSRTLLALKCAVAGLEGTETLVFDEIDAGIGGITALAVGEKLRSLAAACQVVVITHLPQVAAFADRHYLIEKTTGTSQASTRLVLLDEAAVIGEICRMLGARADDPAARAHAAALRAAAKGDAGQ